MTLLAHLAHFFLICLLIIFLRETFETLTLSHIIRLFTVSYKVSPKYQSFMVPSIFLVSNSDIASSYSFSAPSACSFFELSSVGARCHTLYFQILLSFYPFNVLSRTGPSRDHLPRTLLSELFHNSPPPLACSFFHRPLSTNHFSNSLFLF